jgi:arylsulfatase A-like enzyme
MTNRVVRNGTPLDARHDTIARMVRRAGYEPTLFGYTDQSIDPRAAEGDDPWLRTYEGVLPGFSARLRLPESNGPWFAWLKRRGYAIPADPWEIYRPVGGGEGPSNAPPVYASGETETAFVVDSFADWLSEQRAGRPWFAHVSFLRPHPPYIVPAPYNTMFDPADGPAFARRGSAAEERGLHPLVAYWQDITRAGHHYVIGAGERRVADWADADFRVVRAVYYGMIAEVDAEIGRMLAALAEAGMADDTVVVFTSDHGELMGDHWSVGKYGFFDAAYQVPLIVADPRRPAGHGARVAAFTEAVDVVPTLLELCGLAVPGHLDGASLAPFLDGGPAPAGWRTAVHWEYDFREVASGRAQARFGLPLDACSLAVQRGERFKYVHFAGLPPLLFDLADDPAETVDRAGDAAMTRVRLEQAEALLAWRARHLDRRLSGLELTATGVVDGRR